MAIDRELQPGAGRGHGPHAEQCLSQIARENLSRIIRCKMKPGAWIARGQPVHAMGIAVAKPDDAVPLAQQEEPISEQGGDIRWIVLISVQHLHSIEQSGSAEGLVRSVWPAEVGKVT